jgi:hypothetical protein
MRERVYNLIIFKSLKGLTFGEMPFECKKCEIFHVCYWDTKTLRAHTDVKFGEGNPSGGIFHSPVHLYIQGWVH